MNEEALAHCGLSRQKHNDPSSGDFRENSCSESHILLKGGVIFVPFCVHFSSEFKLSVGDVDRHLLGYGS